MNFQPVIPSGGLTGWRFLQRTYDAQIGAFQKTPEITRDTDYFAAGISQVNTAQDLVSDRRLLVVALGAFGLGADIDNRFFIRKILEDGAISDDALANRLSDTRYREFSAAFGFGPQQTSPVKEPGFAQSITDRYRQQSFEAEVGRQDDTMRIALFAIRKLGEIATSNMSDDTKWFTIMGQPPLRSMFETTFGLPASFAQIDIDKQLEVFKERATGWLGLQDVGQFADDETRQALVTKYIARAQLGSTARTSAGEIALSLLRGR